MHLGQLTKQLINLAGSSHVGIAMKICICGYITHLARAAVFKLVLKYLSLSSRELKSSSLW